ncbi:MAG: antitoxin Xre/MbcA/ParS toxin-binding domain-containing protein [Planctomycetaceae bacterium]
MGADARRIDRWRRGRSAPATEHWARLHDLRDLRVLLEAVLPGENARREWLRAAVPLLHGHSPISVIRTGRLDDVVRVLAGLESGAFA